MVNRVFRFTALCGAALFVVGPAEAATYLLKFDGEVVSGLDRTGSSGRSSR